MVRVHYMYMFNRLGQCLHYHEWSRPRRPEHGLAEDAKLVFGLLFSLKQFCIKVDPCRAEGDNEDGSVARSIATDTYKLHFLDSPTGIRIALVTEPSAGDLRAAMRHIYENLYAQMVMRNPEYEPGAAIKCENFCRELDRYVGGLPVN